MELVQYTENVTCTHLKWIVNFQVDMNFYILERMYEAATE